MIAENRRNILLDVALELLCRLFSQEVQTFFSVNEGLIADDEYNAGWYRGLYPPLLLKNLAAGAVFNFRRRSVSMKNSMKHVLSVLVQNQPGVLVRVVSMFSRREFNIDSLSVGVTESPEFSRITVVIHGDEYLVDQMIKQLEKLLDVVAVQRLDAAAAVYRGMTLIKVRADDKNRLDVLKMGELFRAHVIDVQSTTLIFEITGDDDKVSAFTRILSPYGILEVIRTGLISLERGEHTIQEHCEERDYYGKNLL